METRTNRYTARPKNVQNGKTFPTIGSSHDGLKVALFELNYNSIKSCLLAVMVMCNI